MAAGSTLISVSASRYLRIHTAGTRGGNSFPSPESMTRRIIRAALSLTVPLAVALSLMAGPVAAQAVGGAVPSPEDFLGYALGEAFTPHRDVVAYMEELARVTPRVIVREYGVTPEGRELVQAIIASPAHHARIDEILESVAELAQAGTTPARAAEIAAANPAVLYFSYGVHGNEASASEAAMWTAYDLASGVGDAGVVLDSIVLVIDPVTNPDGRERYVNWYRSVVGAEPNADPRTREHREPWPTGRGNHYLFDLNRDWAWLTQPETRARLATWFRWNPQVHVDFHEMNPNSTYFFFPAAAPINPIYADNILAWGQRFGAANARAFDANGWPYFTAESYDLLYPGYGDSWPSLLGSVGMTYEQAGSGTAGLMYERADGDTLTLEMRATRHRTAGGATLRAAAAEKTRLLLDFADANRTAGVGDSDFLLVPGADPSRLDELVDHLLAQGIVVERAAGAMRLNADAYPGFATRRDFPAGTALVRARQPRGRLAVTLLQPETEVRAAYSYDITAWSLPYAYGVEAHRMSGAPAAGWSRAEPVSVPATPAAAPPSAYGYLVAPTDDSAPGIVRYLRDGGTVRVFARSATFAGRAWPAGSWFLPVTPAGFERERITEAGLGGFAQPVAGGLSQAGIDLGSSYARALRLPRIALIGGEGTSATSYGAHWYYLEQQLGMPFDPILLPDIGRIDLDPYDVIVLPETVGGFPEGARDALAEWVGAGGRLVAVGSSAEAVGSIAEIELRIESGDEGDDSTALDQLLATRAERERDEWREEIPGAILQVRLDPDHPLAWGATFDGRPDRLFVLHIEDRVFEPRAGSETVASFLPDLQATSGTVSDANLRLLERGAWLITMDVGDGQVILFADDPVFRLFWRATVPLYRNALLYGGM